MTERNTTVAVSVLATSAMWEVLICTPWCYGWYGLSLSFTHTYILTFSYFQNLKNVARSLFHYFTHEGICSTGVSKTGSLKSEGTSSQDSLSFFLGPFLFLFPFLKLLFLFFMNANIFSNEYFASGCGAECQIFLVYHIIIYLTNNNLFI